MLALSASLVLVSLLVLWREGRFPARVPDDAPAYAPVDLLDALSRAEADPRLDDLSRHRAALDRFVAAMAKTSPRTEPARFPTPEDRVAYWLNAVHALLLVERLDSPDAPLSTWRTWPIGGERLSRAAIVRRFLAESGDARLWLALVDGSVGGPWFDGAPYGGDTLNPQLDDAARRFLRRPDTVVVAPPVVRLSARLLDHEAEFREALPAGRDSLLQVVWAYLPDSCEGVRPGCVTRADLDRACGPAFDRCRVERLPDQERLRQGGAGPQ